MSLERDSVAGRLAELRVEIHAAAKKAKRNPGSVKLVAVTKTVPALTIEEAIAAGQRRFGENRVQEAESKYPLLLKTHHPGLELHLIGPLQSNKVDEAVALFDGMARFRIILGVEADAGIVDPGRSRRLF